MSKNNDEILPLQWIKGVGPRKAEAFAREGIISIMDLVYYFPRSYIDRNAVPSLKALSVKLKQENFLQDESFNKNISYKTEVIVVARIIDKLEHPFGKGRKLLKVVLSDSTGGNAEIRFWNYTDYYKKILVSGELYTISGIPTLGKYNNIEFDHPEIEPFEQEDEKLYMKGMILPVYRLTQGLKNAGLTIRALREIISGLIEKESGNIRETLNEGLLSKLKFPNKKDAVRALHFPENSQSLERARLRMKFEEIFFFEIYLALRKRGAAQSEKGPLINQKSSLARQLYDSLPFTLTNDQKKVIREIAGDMNSGKPMNRLLQGDVGSGKTIVALLSMLVAIDSGFQTAILAPTEILAEQHYNSISKYIKELGINSAQVMGGQNKRMRRELTEEIRTQNAKIVIGTHALFEAELNYNKLGLIIIDEQHRFGVAQRAELKRMAEDSLGGGLAPHVLVMSATPIPRTLSMTYYGDLDVSVIKQMPVGRKPIKTKIAFESQLPSVFDFIKDQVQEGNQAYIVYPLVEKSEKMDLKDASDNFEYLKSEIFPEFKLGLLHGQMFWYEKEEVMKDFLDKKYHILVSTTVIEVGIDVPDATVMLIENAERFGLSQLHQLRGRVGRSSKQSYCILATKDNYRFEIKNRNIDTDDAKANIIRLKTMERTTDGFEIAQVDMKLRGPGDILGTKQSGLPEFKFIDLAADEKIIEYARKKAFALIEADPGLKNPEIKPIKDEYIAKYRNIENFIDIA